MLAAFSQLERQDNLAEMLSSRIGAGCLSQGYLLVGDECCGGEDLAIAVAKALMCADGGCGCCEACSRIERGTHPDVHVIMPEGAAGFLVDQVRQIVSDVNLAPIEARCKVFIIMQVEKLNAASANALLKTLEEPPRDTYFLLLTSRSDSVIPTIRSRCQVLILAALAEDVQRKRIMDTCRCSEELADAALFVCGGSLHEAASFVSGGYGQQMLSQACSCVASMHMGDTLVLLDAAKSVISAIEAPLAAFEEECSQKVSEMAEFLSGQALKNFETAQNRLIAQRKMRMLCHGFGCYRLALRNLLFLCEGEEERVIPASQAAMLRPASGKTTDSRVCSALVRVDAGQDAISYNVNPQIAFEAMLFEIREVLYGTGSCR